MNRAVNPAPVPVGRMLFTLVDPHRGYEAAYNRWYERDHFYAGCMIGPGWFAGARWVAPRALKDLRFPADSPVAQPVDAGSFLSVYWMTEEDPDPTWATRQVRWLYANGRGFDQRDHVHSSIYQYLGTVSRDPDGVPVELALDHHYGGLGVVVVEPVDGVGPDDLRVSLGANAAALFDSGPEVDMLASFGVIRRVVPASETAQVAAASGPAAPGQPGGASLGSSGGDPGRIVQLAFIEGDAVSAWNAVRAYANAIEDDGRGRVTFAAPFHATVVGTDTYTDQLW